MSDDPKPDVYIRARCTPEFKARVTKAAKKYHTKEGYIVRRAAEDYLAVVDATGSLPAPTNSPETPPFDQEKLTDELHDREVKELLKRRGGGKRR